MGNIQKQPDLQKQESFYEYLKQQKIEYNKQKQLEKNNLENKKQSEIRQQKKELSGGYPQNLGKVFFRHLHQKEQFQKQGFWPIKKQDDFGLELYEQNSDIFLELNVTCLITHR
ncbi:hypothetical protein PPERSA_04767 [Pseudocohnilembus persalinus]|uniref:Uncharacterized protein n=1 Tax=Pseudocohnilembus persalinus TaxID=266149 RepID=A0A0V0QP49_PSEPJ|nr:hypothetical protein PPERSA_04767 [Pseudocohnilembus persalinus]|eukprot:KRX03889.1 hypothetical protein PPERSA_04767 [Pseudocohnilembus persalinus]